MRLCDALDQKQMDVRLRDNHMVEGKLTEKDVKEYLSSLKDDSENCIEVSSQFSFHKGKGAIEEETPLHPQPVEPTES